MITLDNGEWIVLKDLISKLKEIAADDNIIEVVTTESGDIKFIPHEPREDSSDETTT